MGSEMCIRDRYITDEFAIGDPVKIPETKDEKPSEQVSGKEKKAKSQPER